MGLADDLRRADDAATLAEMLETLRLLPEGLRQTLADHLWAGIQQYVDEWAYNPALAAGVPLVAAPQTSGLELVQFVAVSVPAGATGILTLGNQQFYFGSGQNSFGPTKLVSATDVRSLTVSAPGPASLWLTGIQQPTYGILAK